MTIVLALAFWSFAAISTPLDVGAGEGDRGAVADRDQEPGTPCLVALVEDEDCPAVLEKSGGGSGDRPLGGMVPRAVGASRPSAPPHDITSQRSRLRIRLRC